MIALMNYIVPLVVLLGLAGTLKLKKAWPVLVAIVLALVYTVAQPNYMPKGTVPPMRIEETQVIDKPIVDRSLKVMSPAEREAKLKNEMKAINDSIEAKIKENE